MKMELMLFPKNEEMQTLQVMAKAACNSKFYNNLGGEAGILSIMLLARELNIPPMQALSGGIWNIQGKVEMSARMMNMKIRQAGHELKVTMSDTACEVYGKRKDTGEEFTGVFTLKDAERAGCLNKTVWKQYPREMLFARALSLCARILFPDVIGNCYVEGEIELKEVKSHNHSHETIKTPEVIVEVQHVNDDQYNEMLEMSKDNDKLYKWVLENESKLTVDHYNAFVKKYGTQSEVASETIEA